MKGIKNIVLLSGLVNSIESHSMIRLSFCYFVHIVVNINSII